jgi:MFS family permease
MMVFMGGAPLGAPIAGWITDVDGVRAGLVVGGAIAATAAVAIGLVLARVGPAAVGGLERRASANALRAAGAAGRAAGDRRNRRGSRLPVPANLRLAYQESQE